MKKKLLLTVCFILLVLAVVLAGASAYFINFAIGRPEYDKTKDYAFSAAQIASMNEGALSGQMAVIQADDGITLSARVIRADEPSSRWAVVIHGYHSDKGMCSKTAYQFRLRGYNVLLPDLRAHGESEGRFIGMGWLDRLDVLRWIDEIIKHDEKAEIILHGTSMGGATVMMVAGEELPQNVKGIVEDCGYTSVWDIFKDQLKEQFGLPEFPLMYTASAYSKLTAGYGFQEASSVKQLKKAKVPVLFIHGSDDDFVNTEMVYEVYEACASVKDILIVEGAGHANSNYVNPDLYYTAMFEFIDRNCFIENGQER